MRGLKGNATTHGAVRGYVALHVSAWIERDFVFEIGAINDVALHVSAWIERMMRQETMTLT